MSNEHTHFHYHGDDTGHSHPHTHQWNEIKWKPGTTGFYHRERDRHDKHGTSIFNHHHKEDDDA